MKLGEKTKLTGIIRRSKVDGGTRDGHILQMKDGPALEIKLNLGTSPHAFTEAYRLLDGLVDQRVEINGVPGSGVAAVFVTGLGDITLINSGAPKSGPKPPRP